MSILSDILRGIANLVDGPMTRAALEDSLDKRASMTSEKLDWRNSIVDLMKLTGQDSSLQNRERLAAELGYQGHYNGNPEMNIWLHEQVMQRLQYQ